MGSRRFGGQISRGKGPVLAQDVQISMAWTTDGKVLVSDGKSLQRMQP